MTDQRRALDRVAELKIPTVLLHGDEDIVTPIDGAKKMRRAMTKAGNKPLWIEFEDDGHTLFREENQTRYFAAFEAFLQAHLSP